MRDGHLVMLISSLQGGTPHRLGQQIVPERRAEFALCLAVHHDHVLVPLGSQLQLAVGVELAKAKTAQALATNTAFECSALVTAHPFGI
ncbi:hypothetical protein D3C87_1826450 [compost metagenome]